VDDPWTPAFAGGDGAMLQSKASSSKIETCGFVRWNIIMNDNVGPPGPPWGYDQICGEPSGGSGMGWARWASGAVTGGGSGSAVR